MENLILKVLAFELAVPTSLYFVNRFIQLTRSSEVTLHLASVSLFALCKPVDNSLLNVSFVFFSTSVS